MNVLYGLYQPDEGEILVDGEPVTFTQPRRRHRRRHRHGAPALHAGAGLHRGRERRARRRATPAGRASSTGAQARREVARALRAYGLDGRPGRARRGPAGRRPAAGRDHQGAVPRRQAAHPRRADRGAHAAGDRRAARVMRALRDDGQVDRLHHPQAARGPGDRRPDHRDPPRQGRRHRLARTRRGRAGRADGRPRRSARGRQGARPARASPVLEVDGLTVVDDARHRASSTASRLDVRGGEILGIAGRAGQRPDRAGRGARRACASRSGAGSPRRSRRHDRPSVARQSSRRASATCPRTAARRPGRGVHRRREPGPRPLRPAAVRQGPRRSTCAAIAANADAAGRGVRRPDLRRPGPASARSPAATSRRSSWPASCPGRCRLLIAAQPTRGVDVGSIEFIHTPDRRASATTAPPSCWSPPSWTRCSASPTGSRSCTAAGSSASVPAGRRRARRSAC